MWFLGGRSNLLSDYYNTSSDELSPKKRKSHTSVTADLELTGIYYDGYVFEILFNSHFSNITTDYCPIQATNSSSSSKHISVTRFLFAEIDLEDQQQQQTAQLSTSKEQNGQLQCMLYLSIFCVIDDIWMMFPNR